MAITKTLTSTVVGERESTWRTNLETPGPGGHAIQVYRETVPIDEAGEPVASPRQNLTPVSRHFDAVNDETVALATGTTIAFIDIIEALSMFADRWAEEDAAAADEPGPMRRRGRRR